MTGTTLRLALILALLLLAAICGVLGGATNALDVALIRDGIAVRAASRWPTDAGLALNIIGGVAATLGVTAAGSLFLWRSRGHGEALRFIGIIAGGRLLIEAIKLIVHRQRPALDPHPVVTHSLSFPSAHAANSMIALCTLALFFAPPRHRAGAVTAAVVASLMIGSSRSLIGVHWPSDVVAGWAIGAAWVIAGWMLAQRLAAHQPQHDVIGGHRPALSED